VAYLIVSEKEWNAGLARRLSERLGGDWLLVDKREDFTLERLRNLNPSIIFVPHWSYFIPESIFSGYETIIFHMTDLPYGRGGSPLQNLIIRGHTETKISAVRATKDIDAGDIYIKKSLSLEGSAAEIFIKADRIIEEMIVEIVTKNPVPCPQVGEVYNFNRRNPEQSSLSGIEDISTAFDVIRMLDAEGYPHAYLESDFLRFEFTNAKIEHDNTIIAHVRVFKK
jgi:methionyl-tRNA formyltransferase